MSILDHAGQRIRLRAAVRDLTRRSGQDGAEHVLVLDNICHADAGDFLGGGRTVVFPKASRRDDITPAR